MGASGAYKSRPLERIMREVKGFLLKWKEDFIVTHCMSTRVMHGFLVHFVK